MNAQHLKSATSLAILASAYNVCGPRSGQAATPATVLAMTDWETLHGYACDYYEAVANDPDALYTVAQVGEAATVLERANAGL